MENPFFYAPPNFCIFLLEMSKNIIVDRPMWLSKVVAFILSIICAYIVKAAWFW